MAALGMLAFSLFLCGIAGYVYCDAMPVEGIGKQIKVYATIWVAWQLAMTAINMWSASTLPNGDLYDGLAIASFICLLLGCTALAALSLMSDKSQGSSTFSSE